MPIGHSIIKLGLLRIATGTIDLIPVAALAFSLLQLHGLITNEESAPTANPHTVTLTELFQIYLHLEAFFLIYFVLQRIRLQPAIPPPQISDQDRGKIFYRALDTSDTRFREFYAPWFIWKSSHRQLSVDEFGLIHKDNFLDWFSWLLYGAPNFSALSPKDSEELTNFLADFELAKGVRIPPGKNLSIEPVILSFNPIRAYPKPLLFYAGVSCVESLGHLYLTYLGFKRIVSAERRYSFDQETGIHYWVRQPSIKAKIQKGLNHCLFPRNRMWIDSICKLYIRNHSAHPDSPVFLIEMPHVAMRFVDRVPSMSQTIAEVESMLDTYGYSKAMVIGHSLGSASTNREIDFVHRHPGRNTATMKANEFMMHWLCSRELHISYTISRHFIWHQSLLWADDLPQNHHVVVSKQDLLVDAGVIETYLVREGVNHTV
ncbi:hypothetical protein BCR33DRAFT_762223 [Rhizoclosmatium globosum]|uniref:Fungal lipase-like domain-containing protein n=1 Tax=Rhizoclosmatium globosum TaxID=329046 RepID=A0A1Y2CXD9_9FUNG|nr:hypothetical protein BCR33DRAFT_762223 [Rhizoclosmatium globosum]|eukprot:ORY51504.1 hypothetical protein BCR33DRAFT_762223 [Rhizoclosmatium globosum]